MLPFKEFFAENVTSQQLRTVALCRVLPLCPVIKQYNWGISGVCESYVKNFALSSIPLFANGDLCEFDFTNVVFAEAWAASHKNGVCGVRLDDGQFVFLDSLINSHPSDVLGNCSKLSILAKVLSVSKPLSIQTHPSVKKSESLHLKQPDLYDANPKPEALVALTQVSLLNGFRKLHEILHFIKTVEPFGDFFSIEDLLALDDMQSEQKDEAFLRLVCERVLGSADNQKANELSCRLYADIARKDVRSIEEEWVYSVQKLYPDGDVGVFFFYILNILTLHPGQCMFIAPGTPHAYLSGQLLEFMYNSDNTLRAGLTDKAKDVKTLLDVTDFSVANLKEAEVIEAENGSLEFVFPKDAGFRVFVMSSGGRMPRKFVCHNSNLEFLLVPSGAGYIEPGYEFNESSMWIVPASVGEYCVTIKDGAVYRVIME